jgi:hypothetical protein
MAQDNYIDERIYALFTRFHKSQKTGFYTFDPFLSNYEHNIKNFAESLPNFYVKGFEIISAKAWWREEKGNFRLDFHFHRPNKLKRRSTYVFYPDCVQQYHYGKKKFLDVCRD